MSRITHADIAQMPPRIQAQIALKLAEQARAAPNRIICETTPAAPIAAKGASVQQRQIARMNKTEEAYSRLLEARRLRGEILWWAFEPLRFRLAELNYYTPDFLVQLVDGSLELHEVKARRKDGRVLITDDAAVKLRQIRETYPMFALYLAIGYRGEFELERR